MREKGREQHQASAIALPSQPISLLLVSSQKRAVYRNESTQGSQNNSLGHLMRQGVPPSKERAGHER
jgi:hypothetical protein